MTKPPYTLIEPRMTLDALIDRIEHVNIQVNDYLSNTAVFHRGIVYVSQAMLTLMRDAAAESPDAMRKLCVNIPVVCMSAEAFDFDYSKPLGPMR